MFFRIKIFFWAICLFGLLALPARAEKRVAVLPFEVLTEEENMKQFGVGTMDTLTMALSNIPEFVMIDRGQLQAVIKENALQQSGFVDPVATVKVGRLLGAEVLVMGSIQSYKDKIRIVAKFTDVGTGKVLQAVQVIGSDIFDLQDKLALEIINQQKVNISINQRKRINNVTRATSSVSAYDYYTKGRTAYFLYTIEGFNQAIELFDQALKADDKYMLALSAKAQAQAIKAVFYKLDKKWDTGLLKEAYENVKKAMEIDQTSAEPLRALAYLNSLGGYVKEAREGAGLAIKNNPNDAEAYYILWISSDPDKIPDPEDPLLIKSLKLNPYLVQARFMRSRFYSYQGKYDKAAVELQKALKVSPSLIQGYVEMAMIYKKAGKTKEALAEFNSALKINPDNEYIYAGLIDYYSNPYIPEMHIKYAKEAIRVNPGNANNHSYLAYDYLRQNNLEEAIAEDKKAIELDPELKYSYANTYLSLGYIYEQLGKTDEALALYQQSLKVKPDDPEAFSNIAYSYYLKGKYDDAIAEAGKALAVKADNLLADDVIGRSLLEQGKFPEAMEKFTQIVKSNPDYISAYVNIGKIHLAQGRISEAINTYKVSIKLNPDYKKVYPEISKAYTSLGNNYYKENKLNEAITAYSEAIKYKPDDSDTYNNLATAYYNSGKVNEAVIEYKKAIFADGKNANAHDNLGIAYEKQGKKAEAISEYKKACELGKQSTCEWLKEVKGEK
jgi:tetratricopeptide (TPR) repeat protein